MIIVKNRFELIEDIRSRKIFQKFYDEESKEFNKNNSKLEKIIREDNVNHNFSAIYTEWKKWERAQKDPTHEGFFIANEDKIKKNNTISPKPELANIREILEIHECYLMWKEWKSEEGLEEKWEQFCRLTFYHFPKMMLMYSKILSIIRKQKLAENEFFKLKLHNTTCAIPDLDDEIDDFEKNCREFIKIYKIIQNRFDFDHASENTITRKIHGNIDWIKTLKNSNYTVPQTVVISQNFKNFDLDTNILLVFSMIKISQVIEVIFKNKSSRIMQKRKVSLLQIKNMIEKIKKNFNLISVMEKGKNLSNYEIDSMTVKKIFNNCQAQTSFENPGYKLFINWFKRFAKNLESINNQNSNVEFKNECTKNFDKMFEIWILLLVYEKINDRFEITEKTKMALEEDKEFKFRVGQAECVFEYDRMYDYDPRHDIPYVHKSQPDYLVKVDGRPLAVYDAKNVHHLGVEPKMKILGYMSNFGCKVSGIIAPHTGNDLTNEYSIKTTNQSFYIFRFNVKNNNLDTVVEKFVNTIENLILEQIPLK